MSIKNRMLGAISWGGNGLGQWRYGIEVTGPDGYMPAFFVLSFHKWELDIRLSKDHNK